MSKVFKYPTFFQKPLNTTKDGSLIYRLDERFLPKKYKKDDLLMVRTAQGIKFIYVKEAWQGRIYEQAFNLEIVVIKKHYGNVRCPYCNKDFLIK